MGTQGKGRGRAGGGTTTGEMGRGERRLEKQRGRRVCPRAGVSQSGQVTAVPTQRQTQSGDVLSAPLSQAMVWVNTSHLPTQGAIFWASLRRLHVCAAAPVLGFSGHRWRSCPPMACWQLEPLPDNEGESLGNRPAQHLLAGLQVALPLTQGPRVPVT